MLLQPGKDMALATFTSITLTLVILAQATRAMLILDLRILNLAALEPAILTSQPSALTPQGCWCAI